jgi:hypothetical protein
MSFHEREGLVTRIRQMRRAAVAPDPAGRQTTSPDLTALQALEVRVAHLEQLLQGLQDSVHRESLRQSRRLADVEARLQPAALGKALSEDARERGL